MTSGFSLIEVLIAVFVIAIGVLGVSSAQLLSLKNNQSAYYRSQANFLVMDMLDRMRANPKGVQDGYYEDIDTSDTDPDFALPACASHINGCTAQELATIDKEQWAANFARDGIAGLIPGSVGIVSTAVTGSTTTVTIEVNWAENSWNNDVDGDGDGADARFSDSTGRVSISARL